jgi:hypothetical protein
MPTVKFTRNTQSIYMHGRRRMALRMAGNTREEPLFGQRLRPRQRQKQAGCDTQRLETRRDQDVDTSSQVLLPYFAHCVQLGCSQTAVSSTTAEAERAQKGAEQGLCPTRGKSEENARSSRKRARWLGEPRKKGHALLGKKALLG